MRRRSAILAMSGFGLEAAPGAAPELLWLNKNGWMPNNTSLPVLLYRGILRSERDLTESLERLVRRHGWTPEWRNGVYPFHHYHSTAHEVLAFSRGEALVQIGRMDEDRGMARLAPVEELFGGRHFDAEIVVLCVR
ncbi:MAG: hypothetical protein FJW39_34985, partial [Acidobacteria bacterium]|nr:hypothetical protein [Acidobacteriota bacterium]